MILPVFAFGNAVLKKKATSINKDYPDLDKLLQNMWETMYNAQGIGLAAPQIGLSIRIFLVDTEQIKEEEEKGTGLKKAFINAEIIKEYGEEKAYEEGCLSIPHIRADVTRKESIVIRYVDENFEVFEEEFTGIEARVIQHEYDHIDGILFTDKIKPLKKRMIKRKLEAIKKGNVRSDYRLRFTK